MNNNKKYYTISEVTKIVNVPASQLRYLERALSTLKVIQLKGRRYYTNENINFIKAKLNKVEANKDLRANNTVLFANNNPVLLKRIDQLIYKFDNVLNSIRHIINPIT